MVYYFTVKGSFELDRPEIEIEEIANGLNQGLSDEGFNVSYVKLSVQEEKDEF